MSLPTRAPVLRHWRKALPDLATLTQRQPVPKERKETSAFRSVKAKAI